LPDGLRGEVISVVQGRRRWTTERKLALVEAAMRSGMSVAGVADRHGVSRSLLFEWRP
jgi:transposase